MICNSCGTLYEGKTTLCLNCIFVNKSSENSHPEKTIQNRSQRRLQFKKQLQEKEVIKRAAKIASYKARCPRCRIPVQQGNMSAHYTERHPTVPLLESTEKIKSVRWIQVFSGGLPGLGKRR